MVLSSSLASTSAPLSTSTCLAVMRSQGHLHTWEVVNSPVSHLNLRFSIAICRNSEKWAISSRFAFGSSILTCSKWVSNDSPTRLSLNLHFNFQIKMPKRKLRSKMGLLNTSLRAVYSTWTIGRHLVDHHRFVEALGVVVNRGRNEWQK